MSNSKIRVLLVEPNELPLELQIENTTEAQEKLTGGPLEICYLNNKDSICLLCNKNARIYSYKPNRFLTNNFIYGNFLIVGNNYDTGNVKSLTKKQVKYYQNYFGQSSIDKSNSRFVARKVVRAILKRRLKMLTEYEDYLYDEKLDLLTKKFNYTHKSIKEIIFVEDLFHEGIESSQDILTELRKLKDLEIETLKLKYNDKYADVPLKRIFGLANKDDTYFSMYGIGYHNPQYPLASFYLNLIKILEEDLMWEESF